MSKKVLFVCLGNICRSPAAEGVFLHLVNQRSLAAQFLIDSAGTSGYHQGEPADKRMREHALKRGYDLTSKSRQIQKEDIVVFDHIIVMDDKNLKNVQAMADAEYQHKIEKLTDYSKKFDIDHVPDPYFGGPKGFEHVLDIVEDACANLLDKLTRE